MIHTLEVIRFELLRNIKKPSFWLAAVALPIILAVYILIMALVGYNTGSSLAESTTIDTEDAIFAVYDEANYLENYTYLTESGAEKSIHQLSSREEGIEAIKANSYDLFFYIPEGFTDAENTKRIEIYTKPDKVSLLSTDSELVGSLLNHSAASRISEEDLAVVLGNISYKQVNFDKEDNHEVTVSELVSRIAGPVAAIIAFYILIVVLGNRLVAAMTEEKENRISELLLTSLKPIHLITGKTISLMILGILQLVVLVLPVLIFYLVAQNRGLIPIEIALELTPYDIITNVILLLSAYFIFTALSIFIGVISPSAKDANSYSSIIVILVILPIMLINVFVGDQNLSLMHFLSYFPPTAPLALMMRGAFNNITPIETWLGIIDILICGALIVRLATYIFCRNALGFNSKVNLIKLLSKPRQSWKN